MATDTYHVVFVGRWQADGKTLYWLPATTHYGREGAEVAVAEAEHYDQSIVATRIIPVELPRTPDANGAEEE